ncbi:replication protein O [Pantoea sp. AS-PWVM4]|nr:replication protein O [Pantoea sp. AS-PWVM4]
MDYQSVIEAYHEILPEMAKVLELTTGRRDKLRSLWRKFDFTQDRWIAYLRYIAKHCRWMCENRADNASGRTWRKKNFDYLITERCYLSVKEERANDLPKTGGQRDVNQTASVDYAHPDGWRGE